MKDKLFIIAFCFMFGWIAGEVFKATYNENIIFSIFCAIGAAIWVNMHILLLDKLKELAK